MTGTSETSRQEGGTAPWEAAYPASLRNYQLDLSDLPAHPAELLSEAAKRFGDEPAFTLVAPDGGAETLSFAEADRIADAFAMFLVEELGLHPGNVIAIQLPNGLHFPVSVFGAWKAGLIVTAVNPLYTPPEVIRQLVDSEARALIAERSVLDVLNATGAMPALQLIAADPFNSLLSKGSENDPVNAPPYRSMGEISTDKASMAAYSRGPVVLYQYTGGTTGRSKPAVITANNLLATAKLVSDFFKGFGEPIEGGAALTVLPLYHIFAFLFGMLVYVRAGTQNVLIADPRPLANLRPAFEGYPIQWMTGVDTLYAGLLAETWFREAPPRLRFAIAGGAAVRPNVSADWEQLVGKLLEGYGLTESTGIFSCNPPTDRRRAGTVGLPVPGSALRIVGINGEEIPIREPGELWVRGPQVVAGYRGAGDVDAFADGWLRTGDIARLDSDGMLTIVDRKKDMILVSGFNVFPNEVEAVIASHQAVIEAAVIGISDERTGEAVRAFVVLREPCPSVDELKAFCRASLAPYKVPREIVRLDALPKSVIGKVLRSRLRNPE